ncbi:hypothetical protein FNH22_25135 [Fulvivirga sp. M361]|uniref:hypothetical protein n=1 Tax=Fulvivirga sp. M361 TaxID=2594266 RepID=UPI00117AECFB|nr:hypothetical protein [Fulvivirga sp. M361]TRX50939.1 hypothetical protein FNH22_25135 [Fulvivirga sp. M361]
MFVKSVFVVFYTFFPLLLVAQDQPLGEIIDTVRCLREPTQSYALYLPTSYSPDQNRPVVIVFEPAARGALPIKQFQRAAEKLGYIVLASNNSRNGSWDIALGSAEAMLADVVERYAVDKDRIYTSGFSGGSRVATSVAVITGQVEGVIACGAGFPNVAEYKPKPIHRFSYVALVGDKDMNYQEHTQVKQELDKMGLRNNKIVFSGIHQWPPANQIVRACYWLELQAFKKGLDSNEHWNANQTFEQFTVYADSLHAVGNLAGAEEVYHQIITDFDGILDLKLIKDKLEAIRLSKAFKKQQKTAEKINRKELANQLRIDEAFNEALHTQLRVQKDSTIKTVTWWYHEIDFWKKIAKTADLEKRHMALRLINFIWAKFATSSFSFSQKGALGTAVTFTDIWLRAEPESKWAHWSMAKLMARKGDVEKSIAHIKVVASDNKNFRGKAIRREPSFTTILDDPRIREVIHALDHE